MDDKLKNYLETLPPTILKNLKVVENVDNTPMLHISIDKNIRKLYPRVPSNTIHKENTTVPRVCVSTDLLGCINAIPRLFDLDYVKYKKFIPYGGNYIYGLIPEHYAVPNRALVNDVEVTNERWLLGYSKETAVYTTKLLGKMFVPSVSIDYSTNNKRNKVTVNIFIEVKSNFPFKIIRDIYVKKGYYIISYTQLGMYIDINRVVVNVEPITKDVYEKRKKLVADTLSYKEPEDSNAPAWVKLIKK